MYGAEAGNGVRHPAVERAAAVGCGFPANALVAQWESIRVTGGGSLVQSQPRVLDTGSPKSTATGSIPFVTVSVRGNGSVYVVVYVCGHRRLF